MLKADIIGHLGGDATMNNVNGKVVINFSVAHTEKYKDKNNVEQTKTVWVSCSYWTERYKIIDYLKKGTQVYVCGQPDVKTYTDNRNQVQPQLTLRVQSIQLLGSTQRNESAAPVSQQQESYNVVSDTSEDLPF